jgi:acyl-coenzyme A thioesterase PaaI-like protein
VTFAGALSLGATAVTTAVALSAGRSLPVERCEIYSLQDGEEKLCAPAQGTIIVRDGNAKG